MPVSGSAAGFLRIDYKRNLGKRKDLELKKNLILVEITLRYSKTLPALVDELVGWRSPRLKVLYK